MKAAPSRPYQPGGLGPARPPLLAPAPVPRSNPGRFCEMNAHLRATTHEPLLARPTHRGAEALSAPRSRPRGASDRPRPSPRAPTLPRTSARSSQQSGPILRDERASASTEPLPARPTHRRPGTEAPRRTAGPGPRHPDAPRIRSRSARRTADPAPWCVRSPASVAPRAHRSSPQRPFLAAIRADSARCTRICEQRPTSHSSHARRTAEPKRLACRGAGPVARQIARVLRAARPPFLAPAPVPRTSARSSQ
ncbi:hypothetical protein QE392_001021 [Microbacterium proteolyticum]|nr:hypothetical protein [Microbacterium sp. SORGH_AS_0344]MDQ1169217.1 hypothetical protein [Microbacterium proteolyticum]